MRAAPDEPIEEMFVIARYVGITGDQLRRLLGVMSLCAIKLTNDQPAAAPAPVDGLVETSPKEAAQIILDGLIGRNGFDAMWDECDDGVRQEIADQIAGVIQSTIAAALQSSDEPEPFGWYFNTGSRKTSGYIHGAERPDERAGWIPLYATPPRKP